MVNKITSFNKEAFDLSVWFVNHHIREDFLQCAKLTRVTSSVIATFVLLDGCDQLGLNVKNVQGQEYDGASNIFCK